MAFVDRVVEYPNRYIFEDGDGNQTGPYTLIRDEGTVTEPGTLLNAQNLTDEITALVGASMLAESVVLADDYSVTHGNYTNSSKSVAKTGYTPIGIVGMRTQNATNGGTYNTYCVLHSFYLVGTTAYFTVRNVHASTDAKIKVTATVLYVKA